MPPQIDARLVELRIELTRGQQRLDALDRERQEVRDTMLRISGAIQVLEELQSGSRTDEGAAMENGHRPAAIPVEAEQ
jgi:hypothetical protein